MFVNLHKYNILIPSVARGCMSSLLFNRLNVEALELDCTPIYSPTTGSILKKKRIEGSPPDLNTLVSNTPTSTAVSQRQNWCSLSDNAVHVLDIKSSVGFVLMDRILSSNMKASWYIAVLSVAHAKLHFRSKINVVSNWSILPMPCAVNNVWLCDIYVDVYIHIYIYIYIYIFRYFYCQPTSLYRMFSMMGQKNNNNN